MNSENGGESMRVAYVEAVYVRKWRRGLLVVGLHTNGDETEPNSREGMS